MFGNLIVGTNNKFHTRRKFVWTDMCAFFDQSWRILNDQKWRLEKIAAGLPPPPRRNRPIPWLVPAPRRAPVLRTCTPCRRCWPKKRGEFEAPWVWLVLTSLRNLYQKSQAAIAEMRRQGRVKFAVFLIGRKSEFWWILHWGSPSFFPLSFVTGPLPRREKLTTEDFPYCGKVETLGCFPGKKSSVYKYAFFRRFLKWYH